MSDGDDPQLPVPGTQKPEQGYQGGAEFFMDFDTVPGLGKMLDQAKEDMEQTARFIVDHAQFKGGEGWFNDLSGKHDGVVEQTAWWFRQLAEPVLGTSARNIEATVKLFQDTEAANRAAVDGTVPNRVDTVDVSLPAWPKTTLEENVPYGPFEFLEDPGDALRNLRSYDDDPSLTYHPQIWDVVSPTGAARATCVKVTEFLAWLGLMDRAYDPFDVFVKPVVGDWAGMRQYADVLRKAGDAAERAGIGVDRARHMLEPVWRGRAADACVVWLGAVAKPMRDAPNVLDKMAGEYERAAQGAAQYRTALDQILTDVIDEVFFIAGALMIGGGGAAATGGISAGAAVLICGVSIYKVIDGIKALLDAAAATELINNQVGAAMNSFGSVQAGGTMPHLPPVSGDASAVTVLPPS